MEIRQLNIKSYGKFTDYRISFAPGLSIICGDNETGKSTMHSFIRSMLFGLERQRGRAGKTDEYSQYLPWQNPGVYGGSMTVDAGGRRLRIERNFLSREKSVRVVDEDEGRELDPETSLKEIRSGLSESSFVNSVFLSQEKARTDAALASELQRYMVNYQETGDKDLDVERALAYLKDCRREIERRRKAEAERLEAQRQDWEFRLDYVREEIHNLQAKRADCEKKLVVTAAREAERRQREVPVEPDFLPAGDRVKLFIVQVLMALISAACFAGAVVMRDKNFRVILAFCGALFLAGVVLIYSYQRRDRRVRRQWKEQVREAKEAQSGGATGPGRHEEQLRWEMNRLAGEIQEKETVLGNLQEELEEPENREELTALERELDAIELAMTRMREISGSIYAETGGDFQREASQILGVLTGGRYTKVSMDAAGEVRLSTPDALVRLNQVSCGTMHQVYLALRLAAGAALEEREPMPVILDDAFALYDDERVEAALRLLEGCGRQVIIFTCQRREREIYEQIKGGR